MNQQLKRYSSSSFGRKSKLIYQLRGSLGSRAQQGDVDIFSDAILSVVHWLKKRPALWLPPDAFKCQTFSYDPDKTGAHVIEAVRIDSEWALRYHHSDSDVPGRRWTTEVGIRSEETSIEFGIKLSVSSRSECEAPIFQTTPGVVRSISKRVGITVDKELTPFPTYLSEEKFTCEDLYSFVISQERSLPVVVISEAPGIVQSELRIERYVIDPAFLAERLFGLAHVFVLPKNELSYRWGDLVGRPWSVFNGAVRTYQPGLNFHSDPLESHPLTKADRIIFWTGADGTIGEKHFSKFLEERIRQTSSRRFHEWGACPKFFDLKRRIDAVENGPSISTEELKRTHEAQVAELSEELEQALLIAEQVEKEKEHYREELAAQKSLIYSLRLQLDQMKSGSDGASDVVKPYPETYDDLEDWVKSNLSDTLFLHRRTARGLKRASFQDIPLVCRALELLAGPYVEMKTKGLGRDSFDSSCKELGLECSPSIAKTRAGEQGDQYFVEYPPGSTQKRFLELHLKKGKNFQKELTLRIYFFYDDEDEKVIVGWLPSHLDTRQS